MNRVWEHHGESEEEVRKLSASAGISPLQAKIFLSRNMKDPQQIREFLHPSLEELHDPFLLGDMEAAVERILLAMEHKEKIIIYGDFDVDGVTSTSLLYTFLRNQQLQAEYYIPDRIEDGYGLSVQALDKVLGRGNTLLITVDCGIVAVDEVEYCRQHGVDVIVTDHHECKETLPAACAVVSPSRKDNRYPFPELAGVGVAFKLVQALCIRLGLGNAFHDYLELAALGTVADVVPLVGENRILVKNGLDRMEKTSNVGLEALLEISGQKDKLLNSWTIAYVLAPRINAAGRMGDALRGVRLFTTGSREEALTLASQLNEENKQRQEQEAVILQEAMDLIAADPGFQKDKVLVLAKEGWHHGIIGIVASKIMERFYKPCIMISMENGMGKGSGRSIEGLDLFEVLQQCSPLLIKFGGHAMAAGLSLKSDQITPFREKINETADQLLDGELLVPRLKIDAVLEREDISLENIRDLEKLAPFGAGNPLPVFEFDGLTVSDLRTVGENKHLKLKLEQGSLSLDAIGFHFGTLARTIQKDDRLDVACALEINVWNASERIQLNLRDLRLDHQLLQEEAYYRSLDQCLDFSCQIENEPEIPAFQPTRIHSLEAFEAILADCSRQGRKPVILVNSLESLKTLEKKFANSYQNIKNQIKICYTSFNGVESDKICVLVNPEISSMQFSTNTWVFFYGPWVLRSYYYRLVQRAGREAARLFAFPGEEDTDWAALVPQRQDLAAVYRFIQSNSAKGSFSEPLRTMMGRIERGYAVTLNYFKLKKILEIFEELGLLTFEGMDGGSVSVTLPVLGVEKNNMENSSLYMALQRLKSRRQRVN